MKIKIILLLTLITITATSMCSCLYSPPSSKYVPPSTSAQKDVTVSPEISPMFISLRFQHIAPNGIEGIGSITPGKLEECLKYLRDNNYHFMSTKEVYDFIVSKVPVPEKSIWLTFDEEMESAYTCATPLLKKYAARATVFVGITWIRKPYRLTNNELIEMSKSGVWDIQTSGYTGNLSFPINSKGEEGNFYTNRLWQIDRLETVEEYKDRIKKDLNDAFKYIKENFNSEKLMFAYPFNENLSGIKNENDTLKLLLASLDELNIIGIGKKENSSIVNNLSTEKHFISRYDVNEYTDLETILSATYIGKNFQYTDEEGKTLNFSNSTNFDKDKLMCWDDKCNFILTNINFQPLGSPVNLSDIFINKSDSDPVKLPILAACTYDAIAMVNTSSNYLIITNKSWVKKSHYPLNFTPASIWNKRNDLYLLDYKGNIYKFTNKPNLTYKIDSSFSTPIRACAYNDTIYIFEDEKKTVSIFDCVQNNLLESKSYPSKYSLIPQLCIKANELIAWEQNSNVFVKMKIK